MDTIFKILKHLVFTFVGAFALFFLFLNTLFSIPIYFYRWLVCKILAPNFNKKLGKALNLHGGAVAFELIGEDIQKQPRCTIVVNMCFEGLINFKELQETVLKRWINSKGEDGSLLYPEFQQYVKGWMGYPFWKTDKNFNVNNHVKKHVIDKTSTEEECEQFVSSMAEHLLNKTFSPKRSPWELNVIYNYRNSEIIPPTSGKDMTVVVMSFHHALADGLAILNALIDGLFGISLSKCQLAIPQKIKKRPIKNSKFFSKILNCITFLFRACRDVGFVIFLTVFSPWTPWHVPEEQRKGKQLYCKSELISVGKMKTIKDTFGVSLTSVLLSSISAGIASSFKSKDFEVGRIPFGVALPLPGHSLKLRNHATGALFQIPVEEELTPSQRLWKSEELFRVGRESTLPFLVPIFMKLTAIHIYPLARLLYKNKFFATACSNFPGSGVELTSDCGRFKLLTKEFGAGLLFGVAGVGFLILSYNGNIRIVVTAENAVMERREVETMIGIITQEIEKLYEVSLSSPTIQPRNTETGIDAV